MSSSLHCTYTRDVNNRILPFASGCWRVAGSTGASPESVERANGRTFEESTLHVFHGTMIANSYRGDLIATAQRGC